jgi:hypothetical protein
MLKVANSVISASRITGVLPVVNGGTGVTTSTGTGNTVLSASPTLSGDVTLSTGNLIPSTAAKGINFTANTPVAGMSSQLLNWYEEGTWTPDKPIDLTVVGDFTALGRYTRVGRLVTVDASLSGATSIACTAGTIICSNLPFAVNSVANGVGSSSKGVGAGGTVLALGGVGSTIVYTSTTYVASAAAILFTVTYSV